MKTMNFKLLLICLLFAHANIAKAEGANLSNSEKPEKSVKFTPPEIFYPTKTFAGDYNGAPSYLNTLNSNSSYGFDKVLLIQGDQPMSKDSLVSKSSSYYVLALKGQDLYYYPNGKLMLKQRINDSGEIAEMVSNYHQEDFDKTWDQRAIFIPSALFLPLMGLADFVANLFFPRGDMTYLGAVAGTIALTWYAIYKTVKHSKASNEKIFNIRQNVRIEAIEKHFGEKTNSKAFYVKRSEVFEYKFQPKENVSYTSCKSSGKTI
ncbi:MAG: hypothetical protein VX583_00555 [Bdellovibrionota bacterium]|nr:hypothetical protein [Pseudobdellovibrionaceae bacterium]|tara:strand:- start:1992 stop:2780 length:789 start_codon:yes stop_codon:yes gene_type:complete